MGSRRRARELALQLLYQYELTHGEPEQMQADFDEWRGATDAVREFADGLLRGTLEHLAEIDGELERQTAHWRLDRLAAVDRNILRIAMFELLFQSTTPHAVICVGALVRGGTPHFDVITAEVAKGIAQTAMASGVPVTFGVITADTLEQAVERAGTKMGNKGWEAALAAIEMARLYRELNREE